MIYRPAPRRVAVRAAFTLMEMLVVVAIIVALAGMGGYYLIGTSTQAKIDMASNHVKTLLTNACQMYALQHADQFPPNLAVLTIPDEQGRPALIDQDALYDPWGQLYEYVQVGPNNGGAKPDIWSKGPNGQMMIGNWPKTATGI